MDRGRFPSLCKAKTTHDSNSNAPSTRFTKEFVVKMDASNVRIGRVLMQARHLLAYFNKKLGPRLMGTSTYIRELRAVVNAVAKW